MRIAGLSEHRHLERTLRPRDPLSRGPVRSRGGKWHVFSLVSREASHRPPRHYSRIRESIAFLTRRKPGRRRMEVARLSPSSPACRPRGRFRYDREQSLIARRPRPRARAQTAAATSFRSRRSKYKPWASRLPVSAAAACLATAVTVRARSTSFCLNTHTHKTAALGSDETTR